MSESQELSPVVDFIAGTISGIVGLVVGYPFDTVKVRFQHPDFARKYSSTTNAIFTIIREEKFFGLFKGITSPLSTSALMNGLIFASYRFLLKVQTESRDSVPTLFQVALAGAGCGVITSVLTTPVELIKIRQQADTDETSISSVAMDIVKTSGVIGLYRGFTATAIREIGYGAYFWSYEATCRYFNPTSLSSKPSIESDQIPPTPSWGVLLFAGAIAGIVGWLATFPFDVIKTRIQGSNASPSSSLISETSIPLLPTGTNTSVDPYPYRTTMSTIVNSYREEGIGVFYRGIGPTLIRAVPANAVTFVTFDMVVKALS